MTLQVLLDESRALLKHITESETLNVARGGMSSNASCIVSCLRPLTCCGKEGHKKADCKFKTATCSNSGKVGHLRVVCRNTNTHEIEKDADEPSPEFTVLLFKTLSTTVTVLESRSMMCFEKIVTSQKSKNSPNIVTRMGENRIQTKDEAQDIKQFVNNALKDQKLEQDILK